MATVCLNPTMDVIPPCSIRMSAFPVTTSLATTQYLSTTGYMPYTVLPKPGTPCMRPLQLLTRPTELGHTYPTRRACVLLTLQRLNSQAQHAAVVATPELLEAV